MARFYPALDDDLNEPLTLSRRGVVVQGVAVPLIFGEPV